MVTTNIIKVTRQRSSWGQSLKMFKTHKKGVKLLVSLNRLRMFIIGYSNYSFVCNKLAAIVNQNVHVSK